jgi:hypothetical protein
MTMGWHRKGEHRLYFERAEQAYLLVEHGIGRWPGGNWGAICNVYPGSSPSLVGGSVSDGYLYARCRRESWNALPAEWQCAFLEYMNRDPDNVWRPENEPGLFRVGEQRPRTYFVQVRNQSWAAGQWRRFGAYPSRSAARKAAQEMNQSGTGRGLLYAVMHAGELVG